MIQLLDRVQLETRGQSAVVRLLQKEDAFHAAVHQRHGAHEAGFAQQIDIVAGAQIGSVFAEIIRLLIISNRLLATSRQLGAELQIPASFLLLQIVVIWPWQAAQRASWTRLVLDELKLRLPGAAPLTARHMIHQPHGAMLMAAPAAAACCGN